MLPEREIPPSATIARHPRAALRTIAKAGLIAGALDILYIVIFFQLRGVGAERVLQGVAAGALGRAAAINGGLATAALGLAIHFGIALAAAAAFYAASRPLRALVRRPILGGFFYGAVVWLVMNLVVLPLSATPPASFPGPMWMPVLIAHLVCIGPPIALVVREGERERARG